MGKGLEAVERGITARKPGGKEGENMYTLKTGGACWGWDRKGEKKWKERAPLSIYLLYKKIYVP